MAANHEQPSRPPSEDEFLREASEGRIGLAAEFWDFLKHNKKWWLLPILIVLVGLGVLVALGSSAAVAPFIYPF